MWQSHTMRFYSLDVSNYVLCRKTGGIRDYHTKWEKNRQRKVNIFFFLFEESRLKNKYVFIYTHIYITYTYESRNRIAKRKKEV